LGRGLTPVGADYTKKTPESIGRDGDLIKFGFEAMVFFEQETHIFTVKLL